MKKYITSSDELSIHNPHHSYHLMLSQQCENFSQGNDENLVLKMDVQMTNIILMHCRLRNDI